MVHALADFVQKQTDARGWRNRDLAKQSGLSVQVCSNYLNDKRASVTRLPDKKTVDGFARAFSVAPEFLLGKAIESLDLGYTSGDFINAVETASNRDLLIEIGRRLGKAGEGDGEGRSPSMTDAERDDSAELLDFTQGRDARKQRLLDQAQPQRKAGYDGDEEPPEK